MAESSRRKLLRDAAVFQLKVLLDAFRDLILSPLSLLAAVVDLLLSGSRKPELFYRVLRFGRRSEDWIDLWAAGRREQPERPGAQSAANADWLMDKVEALVRDPRSGAHNARVLKRWARRRLASAAKRKPE